MDSPVEEEPESFSSRRFDVSTQPYNFYCNNSNGYKDSTDFSVLTRRLGTPGRFRYIEIFSSTKRISNLFAVWLVDDQCLSLLQLPGPLLETSANEI